MNQLLRRPSSSSRLEYRPRCACAARAGAGAAAAGAAAAGAGGPALPRASRGRAAAGAARAPAAAARASGAAGMAGAPPPPIRSCSRSSLPASALSSLMRRRFCSTLAWVACSRECAALTSPCAGAAAAAAAVGRAAVGRAEVSRAAVPIVWAVAAQHHHRDSFGLTTGPLSYARPQSHEGCDHGPAAAQAATLP